MRAKVKSGIICTIGPASGNMPVLRKMMLAGMDIARINASHGNEEERQLYIDLIRKLNTRHARRVRILLDLEGCRIRLGSFKDSCAIELKKKQSLLLTNKKVLGHGSVIPFDYAGPLTDIKTGTFIYIDDGTIALVVKSSSRDLLKTEVAIPGILKEHKGVNIPAANLSFDGLSDSDKANIRFGISNNVDYIAQSFVRTKGDITAVRERIVDPSHGCRLIAKIENHQGIRNVEEIMDVSDGIMIARGDMGVSLPIYEIPIVQKLIIKKCNRRKKLVITATQMLESMTEHLRPTRAEVTDVANAILDGTDLVMLSAETAVGKYPVECVRMMSEIIRFTREAVKLKVVNGAR